MRRMTATLALLLVSTMTFGVTGESEETQPEGTGRLAFLSTTVRWVFKSPFWAGVGVAAVSPDALALSMMNQCQGLANCPVTIEVCDPVILTKQTDNKTVVERGGWKATLKGDFRSKTFLDRMECEKAARIEPTGVVGMTFSPDLTILTVVPGSPAAEAGLTPGRHILRIAGEKVDSLLQAQRLIRGLPGTEVEIVVERNGVETVYNIARKPWSEVFKSPESLGVK